MRQTMFVAALPMLFALSCSASTLLPTGEVSIHSNSAFYQELPEPEQIFEGVVRVRQTAEPPPNRIGGRWYNLVVNGVAYPMPAPREQLAVFTDKTVTIRGKIHAIVWPDDQLPHEELWVGTIKLR